MRKLLPVWIILSLVLFWYLSIRIFNIPRYLLPSPSAVAHVFITNPRLLLESFTVTFIEAFLGFVIANFLSAVIALTISLHKGSEYYVLPVAIVLKTIPIVAIAPLLILWFGSSIAPKVATAALICFFPSLVSIVSGIKSMREDYLDLFKIYNASNIATVRHLFIPYSLPFIFSSLKISSSLAVVGALVGEFLGSNMGLGFLIITSYYSLNTPIVFAAVILTSSIGLSLFYAIHYLESKILTWKY